MALAAVLSAMREIILDFDGLPSTFDARKAQYAESCPGLTEPELEDLAKILPERWQVYTHSIFSGEASVLRNHLPVTLALLEYNYPKDNAKGFDLYDLVRRSHKVRPWRDNITETLVHNFKIFLEEDMGPALSKISALQDMATLELTTLQIKRDSQRFFKHEDSQLISTIAGMSVDRILGGSYKISTLARFVRFDRDVLAFRKQYWAMDRKLDGSSPVKREVFAVGGRSNDNTVNWEEINRFEMDLLSGASREVSYRIEDWAEGFGSNQTSSQPEEELFVSFLSRLLKLSAAGVIQLELPTTNQ